jgi:hypothetical protein
MLSIIISGRFIHSLKRLKFRVDRLPLHRAHPQKVVELICAHLKDLSLVILVANQSG